MNRRGFLGGALVLIAARTIVRASSLMPVNFWRPILWGDGVRDDTEALQALLDGLPVLRIDGGDGLLLQACPEGPFLPYGTYLVSSPIHIGGMTIGG